MKIYIAGSFATEHERTTLEHMIELARSKYPIDGFFVPMEHCVPFDHKNEDGTWYLTNPAWAQEVFNTDITAMRNADHVIAMYTGHRSTTGTAWELGFAYAIGIPITLYIPAWAKKNDFSLMVLNSASNWMDEKGEVHPVSFDWLNQFNQK